MFITSMAAVMVERPFPSATVVSPATEIERLRDWVREQALPWLITGAKPATSPVPVTIELGDDGRTLRERIAAPSRPSGAERLAAINGRRFLEAEQSPVKFPMVVDEEFDD